VAGKCGCGVAENDSDGDGTVDCIPGHFYEAENGQLSPSADAGAIEDASSGADGAVPTGPFTIGADVAASAGHYIVAPAGSSESQPGSARASYDINITKADMYVIWGRFYSPDRAHNCVWARVDGGVWSKWRGTTGETWFWYHFHKEGEWATPLLFQLSMGSHTLEIANCTDNTKLDRLYITAGGDKPPGDVTICNPPHTVEIGGQCVSSCGQLGGTSCDALACAGQTVLPAYDCAVCCTPSEAGTADATSSVDTGVESSAVDTGTTE
jgi:hypothetical protein